MGAGWFALSSADAAASSLRLACTEMIDVVVELYSVIRVDVASVVSVKSAIDSCREGSRSLSASLESSRASSRSLVSPSVVSKNVRVLHREGTLPFATVVSAVSASI